MIKESHHINPRSPSKEGEPRKITSWIQLKQPSSLAEIEAVRNGEKMPTYPLRSTREMTKHGVVIINMSAATEDD